MGRLKTLTRKKLVPQQMRWLLGERKRTIVVLTLASLATGFCEAGILAIFAQAASALVNGQESVPISLGPINIRPEIGTLLLIAAGLSVARIGLGIVSSYLPPKMIGNVQAQLRRNVLYAYEGASWEVQAQDREGHLQEILSNQANQASWGAGAATGLVGSILAFLVLLLTALLLNPLAVLVVLAMAMILFGILHPLRNKGREGSKELSDAQLEVASMVGEMNRMAEETQVFGVARAQGQPLDDHIEGVRRLFVRTQTMLRLAPNVYQSVLYFLMVVGLGAIYLLDIGDIPSLGAVVLLLIRAGTYGQAIQGGFQIVHQAMPYIEAVDEKAKLYEASVPADGGAPLDAVRSLAFEDVSFAYRPGARVLSDLSFEVAAGEAIGLVGPSGAGKSSTIQILLRLREPTSGRYLVNGVPAREFSRQDWQSRVAYVPQEPNLIRATVADNIRYFREISDEQVERAARLAHIHDDIVGWPGGYDRIVGPRADAVSGGQRQRICLARALAAEPDILILDEPTSALDPRSEALVQRSLDELKHHLTLFVIAHGSTLLDICNRVMVIVDGRLEAFDTLPAIQQQSSYQQAISDLGLTASRERTLTPRGPG
jgi:ABC-type multidrug transport system fused ATPase/permease subunit